MAVSSIVVRRVPLPPPDLLQALWEPLQARADGGFFLSWTWIGSWLHQLGPLAPRGRLVCAEAEGRPVGLAVVFAAPIRLGGVFVGTACHVNESGQPGWDPVHNERNGFLLDARCSAAAAQAMLDSLLEPAAPWRELRIRHLHRPGLAGAQPHADLLWTVQPQPTRVVDLQQVRERGGDYLGLLGSSHRANLRRSRRAAQALGPLRVDVAADLDTAWQFLERLVVLHRQRWAALGRPSQFATERSLAFHRHLIAQALPRGEVQLLRLRAGERDVGYLYQFVFRGHVSFYQSGYDYALLGRAASPGLLTLAEAIAHHAEAGAAVFDFLPGDQPYKRALATQAAAVESWTVQHDGWVARTERALRRQVRDLRERRDGLAH